MSICPLMHEYAADHGWEVLTVTHAEHMDQTHVLPCADMRRHQLDPSCWCKPTPIEDTVGAWTHNSADRREFFETGQQAAN